MSDWRGDYMGFTYNGTHSSDLGIVRVSDGSRFNENLLPTIKDKTVQVPGGDGTYYFGSQYTQRQFNISFAFDDLTETQIARIKRVFGDKQIHDLIFDEIPYKVWSAKVTGTASIKYIPFAEGKTNRLYKGEGTIQFTCYYPYARCRFKTLEECQEHSNWKEWILASRIAIYDEDNKEYKQNSGNFGDIAVPFKCEIQGEGSLSFGNLTWKLPDGVKGILNTKTGIVKQIIDGKESEEILNGYISGDTTAKIPVELDEDQLKEIEDKGLEFDCYYI